MPACSSEYTKRKARRFLADSSQGIPFPSYLFLLSSQLLWFVHCFHLYVSLTRTECTAYSNSIELWAIYRSYKSNFISTRSPLIRYSNAQRFNPIGRLVSLNLATSFFPSPTTLDLVSWIRHRNTETHNRFLLILRTTSYLAFYLLHGSIRTFFRYWSKCHSYIYSLD